VEDPTTSHRRPVRRIAAVVAIAVVSPVALIPPVAVAQTATPRPPVVDLGPDVDPYPGWTSEQGCTAGVRPGTTDLADFIASWAGGFARASDFLFQRACAANAESGHDDGRALDWVLDATDPADRAVAAAFLDWLTATDRYGNGHANARRLGVMYVIWDTRIWRAYRAADGWTTYTGSNPHTDHIHVSLTPAGADRRTTWWSRAGDAVRCDGDLDAPLWRRCGPDRYATSVALGRGAAPRATTVVVASGEDRSLVDGLVAGPLARALSAPLLLARVDRVPPVVEAELTRRRATRAVLVGGESVLGPAVETQLRTLGVTDIVRVAGPDRYATAGAVAQRLRGLGGSRTEAFVASGEDASLVDALSVAGPAARLGVPVLLSRQAFLPASTVDALAGVGTTTVVGAEGVVSAAVEARLPAPRRLAGPDRYATAVAVAVGLSARVPTSSIVVSSGRPANLVDAMPAGALARPVLLVDGQVVPPVVGDWAARTDVTTADVAGSRAVLGTQAAQAFR
jgi:putative cell wall-binding protein